MSESKSDFALKQISDLIDKVIEAEGIPKESQSYDDLQWIKFHAKDLNTKCKGCEDTPSGSKNETAD